MSSKLSRYLNLSLYVCACLFQACNSSAENSDAETSDNSSSNSLGDESEAGDSKTSKSDASTNGSGSTTGGETESGDTSSGSDASTDASSDSSSGTTSNSESETGSETGSEAGTETGSESSETGSSEEGDTAASKMNGEQCAANEECESEQCNFSFGEQGICSECVDDAACRESGKGLNCTLGDFMTTPWFVCGEGKLGEGCMSDEGCMEKLACADLGLFGITSCSECKVDKDCTTDDKTLCVVKFPVGTPDSSEPEPHQACQAPGSLKNGDLCNMETSGDEACEHHCAEPPLELQLPSEIGMCGECRNDDDCKMGETCEAASLGSQGLNIAMCKSEDDETTGDSTGDTTGDSETETGDTGDTTTAI